MGTPTVTNLEVGERAGVPTISHIIAQHRLKFLGRVLRGSQEDLIHSTCFTPGLNIRELRGPNRRGRPRMDWLKGALKEAWEMASQVQQEEQIQELLGEFTPPHSIIPLRKAAQNVSWWDKYLVKVPTRRDEDFDHAL